MKKKPVQKSLEVKIVYRAKTKNLKLKACAE